MLYEFYKALKYTLTGMVVALMLALLCGSWILVWMVVKNALEGV